MTKGEHTNERTYVRTYAHTYVRDRPYIPSTTLLCEGIKNENHPKSSQICICGIFFHGTQRPVQSSRGKRFTSVLATGILFNFEDLHLLLCFYSFFYRVKYVKIWALDKREYVMIFFFYFSSKPYEVT